MTHKYSSASHSFGSSKILLDIGGWRFTTRLSTLTCGMAAGSMLATMFSGRYALDQDSEDGSYFIDRDGTYFGYVLNFLRDPANFEAPFSWKAWDAVRKDADYYQLAALKNALFFLPAVYFPPPRHQHSFGAGTAADVIAHLEKCQSSNPAPEDVFSSASVHDEQFVFDALEKLKVDPTQLESIRRSLRFEKVSDGHTGSSFLNQENVSFIAYSDNKPRLCVMIELGESKLKTKTIELDVKCVANISHGGHEGTIFSLSTCDIVTFSADDLAVGTAHFSFLESTPSLNRSVNFCTVDLPEYTRQLAIFLTIEDASSPSQMPQLRELDFWGRRHQAHGLIVSQLRELKLFGEFHQARSLSY